MTLTLPDPPVAPALTPEEARLELACALYARGRIGRVQGTELAGVDFFTFQRALGERGIAMVTAEMIEDDATALRTLFRT
ncbi:MAG: UPF0175 family protein [Verrucomicrobia bacterium]|nr:UPF0175 family protein [Verrucomicrobiota bacterium]